MRVDSSGRVLVGTSTARANFLNASLISPTFQIEGTAATNSIFSVVRTGENTNGPRLLFGKARGSTLGSTTIVQADDQFGSISFEGTDGTNFVEAAFIGAFVDGTPSANVMPGRLAFYTAPATSAAGVTGRTEERMRIDAVGNVLIGTTTATAAKLTVAGHIYPATSNTHDLGSSTARWRNIYTGDLHLANKFGDYTIVEGEDELFLYNNKKNKVYKFALIEVDANTAPPKAS